MISVGVSPKHPAIQKAVKWLLNIQNHDGGWGESCKSDIKKTYVPLGASTLTKTAWALDALIAVFDEPIPEIQAGIKFILQSAERDDWTTSYPTGQAMAGGFYIHYHSYQHVFPLLTLSHYQKNLKSMRIKNKNIISE
jgi:sporulenol synthase